MASALRQLPIATVVMSVPLYLTAEIRHPSTALVGLPFVVLYTWGLLSVLALPLLIMVETCACAWMLSRRELTRPSVSRHVAALGVAVVAEIVFLIARRGPA